MTRGRCLFSLALIWLASWTSASHAQHLWWDKGELQDTATCLYGEIIVLATSPGIYYSSAGWWPGEAAGGYCGIQHNTLKERRTIFSIWDTSPELRPSVIEADSRTMLSGKHGARRVGTELVQEGSKARPPVWRLEQVGDAFRIMPETGTLAVEGSDSGKPATIQLRRRNDAANQLWQFKRVGDAYQIISQANGLALDVFDNAEHDGSRVGMWEQKAIANSNQLWILSKVTSADDSA